MFGLDTGSLPDSVDKWNYRPDKRKQQKVSNGHPIRYRGYYIRKEEQSVCHVFEWMQPTNAHIISVYTQPENQFTTTLSCNLFNFRMMSLQQKVQVLNFTFEEAFYVLYTAKTI
jgi:hypothetical protein